MWVPKKANQRNFCNFFLYNFKHLDPLKTVQVCTHFVSSLSKVKRFNKCSTSKENKTVFTLTVRHIVIYAWLTNNCVQYIIGNKLSYSYSYTVTYFTLQDKRAGNGRGRSEKENKFINKINKLIIINFNF